MNHSDPNAVLTIVVGLKRHNEAEFTDLLDRLYDADSPDYHRWITPTDFLAKFSPSQVDVDAVRQHLESHGLTVNRVSDNRVLVQATGTVLRSNDFMDRRDGWKRCSTPEHWTRPMLCWYAIRTRWAGGPCTTKWSTTR